MDVIKTKLTQEKVIGEVLDDFSPQHELHVSFSSGASVDGGNVLFPKDVAMEPTKVEWGAEEGAFYTLVKTDPDAPSRANPTRREWCHWIVGNVRGNDWKGGETLVGYVGAGPPEGTGLHRYVYVVYRQSGQVDFTGFEKKSKTQGSGRAGFRVRDFANQFNLGSPVAANFYLAEYDDSVPQLHASLK